MSNNSGGTLKISKSDMQLLMSTMETMMNEQFERLNKQFERFDEQLGAKLDKQSAKQFEQLGDRLIEDVKEQFGNLGESWQAVHESMEQSVEKLSDKIESATQAITAKIRQEELNTGEEIEAEIAEGQNKASDNHQVEIHTSAPEEIQVTENREKKRNGRKY
jgi:uncharacterized protein YoxC